MKTFKILAFCTLSVCCLAGCRPSDDTGGEPSGQFLDPNAGMSELSAPRQADFLPAFVLPTLEGGSFDSTEQGGRVLLINFWATWCAPCRVEIPDLVALHEELGSENFAVIGISLDMDEPEFVKEFAKAMKINYPVLLDDGEVAEAFGGVYALPTTFVVDKSGKITHRTIGLFPIEAVKEELNEMINAD